MKKFAALALIITTILSFSACSFMDKIAFSDTDYEEKLSKMNEKQSEKASKIAQKKEESVSKAEDEIGKTIKDERLVTKRELNSCTIYEVIVFKKDGDVDYTKAFYYYNSSSAYSMALSVGDDGNNKLIKHDDDIMMLVYKNTKASMMDFDTLYKIRENSNLYQIIE